MILSLPQRFSSLGQLLPFTVNMLPLFLYCSSPFHFLPPFPPPPALAVLHLTCPPCCLIQLTVDNRTILVNVIFNTTYDGMMTPVSSTARAPRANQIKWQGGHMRPRTVTARKGQWRASETDLSMQASSWEKRRSFGYSETRLDRALQVSACTLNVPINA